MRRSLTTWLTLCLVGCGNSASSDAGTDAATDARPLRDVLRPFDAGPQPLVDAGDDAPDSGDDAGPWTSEWLTEPSVEIVDDTPCEDWEPVTPMARGLPADPTPRVLWEYHPEEDPLYDVVRADFQTHVGQPTMSPDGTIWVQGPNVTDVSQLTREGRIRRWYRTNAFRPDDPGGSNRIGPMAVLPDGVLVLGTHGDGADAFGTLERHDPTWPESTYFRPSSERAVGMRMNFRSQIAVGPGGMVYVSAGNIVTATCQARRTMWVLTNRVKPGEEDMNGELYPHVLPTGELLLDGTNQRQYRVSADGSVSADVLPIEIPTNYWQQINEFAGRVRMATAGDSAEPSGDVARDIYVLEGDRVTAQTEGRVLYSRLSPTGFLVTTTAAGVQAVGLPPYDRFEPIVGSPFQFAGFWFSDGSIARAGMEGFQRLDILPSGAIEIRWTLAAHASGIAENRIMDEQGIQYHASFLGMTAIQTDGLPPPLTMCVDRYCNGYRDRWMRPE